MKNFSLAIHGGAGTLVKGMMTPDLETQYKTALQNALDKGYAILEHGGTAIDEIEKAVIEVAKNKGLDVQIYTVDTTVDKREENI